jgi:metal-responsive CopG/Arc/MetJ family transcriptional regulator
MKVVQVSLDERLLERLDANVEVRKRGRSAIVREALAYWLAVQRETQIADAYARAYGGRGGIADEFPGWAGAGTWPDE